MKTCTYNSIMARPAAAVAPATRHDWPAQGWMYRCVAFIGSLGTVTKASHVTNALRPEAGR